MIKTKLNSGHRGLKELPKDYEMTFEEAIIESWYNGQKEQCIEYFNRANRDKQKEILYDFLSGWNEDSNAKKIGLYLIKNL